MFLLDFKYKKYVAISSIILTIVLLFYIYKQHLDQSVFCIYAIVSPQIIFAYSFIKMRIHDEITEKCILKARSITFLCLLVLLFISTIIYLTTNNQQHLFPLIAINLFFSSLVNTFSLNYYLKQVKFTQKEIQDYSRII